MMKEWEEEESNNRDGKGCWRVGKGGREEGEFLDLEIFLEANKLLAADNSFSRVSIYCCVLCSAHDDDDTLVNIQVHFLNSFLFFLPLPLRLERILLFVFILLCWRSYKRIVFVNMMMDDDDVSLLMMTGKKKKWLISWMRLWRERETGILPGDLRISLSFPSLWMVD